MNEQNKAILNYKKVLCRNFSEGKCMSANLCTFAHGNEELMKYSGVNTEPSSEMLYDPKKYKTQMCQHYEAKGYCRKGDSCSFAHGLNELKIPIQNDILSRNISDNNTQNNNIIEQFKDERLRDLEENMKKYFSNSFEILKNLEKLGNNKSENIKKIEENIKNLKEATTKYKEDIKDTREKIIITNKPEENTNEKKKAQLNYISDELKKCYIDDTDILTKISKGTELLTKDDIFKAAAILEEVLFNKDVSDSLKKKHNDILISAKNLKLN